jgi:hypothetical protein
MHNARGSQVNNYGEFLARVANRSILFHSTTSSKIYTPRSHLYRWRISNCQSYCSGGSNAASTHVHAGPGAIVFGTIIAFRANLKFALTLSILSEF